MEAVRNQLRSGLTWAPQNDSRWCQSDVIGDGPIGAFKPKVVTRASRIPQPPPPPPARDAFREILEKFQD